MIKSKSLMLTQSAVFAALICIISPVSILIGPIPITFSIFAIVLAGVVLEEKLGAVAVIVYLILGACGLPVFSGGRAGIGVFLGITGGYLWGYPIIAYLSGKQPKIINNKFLRTFLPSLLGLSICYLFASIQYMVITKVSFLASVSVCVLPFVLLDIIKVLLACLLGISFKKRFSHMQM